jgi:hypothetical protein
MDNAAGALGNMLCVLAIAIPIGLLIGGGILMGACALFNTMVGATASGRAAPPPYNPYDDRRSAGPDSPTGLQDRPDRGFDDFRESDRDLGIRRVVGVPQPDLLKAMGIVLVVGVVNTCSNFVISQALGAPAGLGLQRRGDPMAGLLANLISLPIDFLVEAGLLTALLPTTFGKAALVTLLHYLILLAIGVVIFLTCLGVGLGLR